jgi:CRP-like cAMP-binding protein
VDEGSTLNGDWPADSLLGQLRGRARDALLELGSPVAYTPNHVVIRQGADGSYALLLLSGVAKVVVSTEFGRDVLIGVRGAGDLVGETGALDGGPRFASVVTCIPTHARLIKRNELTELLERNAEIGMALARMIGEQLRIADRRRVEFAACPAPARVARVLSELVARHGIKIPGGWQVGFPLNQVDIASMAGVALSTVEKALQALQDTGIVQRRYRQIVVRDIDRLGKFGVSVNAAPGLDAGAMDGGRAPTR